MKIGLSSLPFVVLLAPCLAYGESERIEKFSSDIAIARDGSLRVTETIKVFAAGDKIEHGIYRDLLTAYQNSQGERARTAFEIEEVTRNGEKEPFRTASSSDSLRVYAGSEDVRVSYGWNTYTFNYRADRGVGFFKDRDELFWNVNGTAWELSFRSKATRSHRKKRRHHRRCLRVGTPSFWLTPSTSRCPPPFPQ
jgi:hypothetical protein